MMTSNNILQLKITLKHIRPPIWRRIQITDDNNFLALHAAIQDAFGWEDYHLHHFIFETDKTKPRKFSQFIGPPSDENFVEYIPEKQTLVKDWLDQEGKQCLYEYDFGDGWEHTVLLEKILPVEAGATYPRCVAGKRACPPEDSGGIPGYEYKLDILKHPRSKYYKETLEWIGEDFDPERFSPNEVVFQDVDVHDVENWEQV